MTQYVTKYKGYPIRDAEAREQLNNIANKKIDDITLSNNVLTLLANSKTIKTITLPTSTTGGGTNGKEIELQKSTTHIQWRYVGDTDWNNLVALNDLRGSDGRGIVSIENTSGMDLDMEYTITYTDGTTDTFWITNGAKGDKGDTGLSAYELAQQETGFAGTVEQWLNSLVGATPNLQIGTVETLASGSSATASITGTTENPLLNLGIPKGADGGGTGTGGSSETLVTDYTYNSNQEIYPTALDLETGVFTCTNHGLSTNDIILVVLDYRVTNIPFEMYSASINYFSTLKADVVDSDTFKIKLGDTDLVYTNSNNTNVDVTKFHFEKVTSPNLIKVDNLNLKNVRVEVYGKIFGAYPVIVGLFDDTGTSLIDNKSKMTIENNIIKEENSFATLVYEELILRNNILKLNGNVIKFKKDEAAYKYLITYPHYYSNQSTITNASSIIEIKEYDIINHISLSSTIQNKISNLASYNYFANGTKFKIYDLGEN